MQGEVKSKNFQVQDICQEDCYAFVFDCAGHFKAGHLEAGSNTQGILIPAEEGNRNGIGTINCNSLKPKKCPKKSSKDIFCVAVFIWKSEQEVICVDFFYAREPGKKV